MCNLFKRSNRANFRACMIKTPEGELYQIEKRFLFLWFVLGYTLQQSEVRNFIAKHISASKKPEYTYFW